MSDTGQKLKHILVIDDDPVMIKMADKVLSANGYEVTTASEAADGLEAAMKSAPDLIILDVMMPIINGFNICRLLKSEEECKSIPIILLTARSNEDDVKIGQDVGANAHIAKPFKSEELLGKVKELLS